MLGYQGQRERWTPLTKIMRLSCPRLGQTMVLPCRGFKYHIRTELFYSLDFSDNTASTDLSFCWS